MKRIRTFLSILLIFVSLLGTGCLKSENTEPGPFWGRPVSEYEGFLKYISSKETTDYNLPEDFLDTCGYTDGKFYLDVEKDEEYLNLTTKMERSLMWLSFEQAEYEDAKNRILVDIVPLNHQEKEYNGYHFYIKPLHQTWENMSSWCRMISYNDQKCTLLFMGMWCEETLYPEVEYMSTDFGLYLETFFGDFYDFDA